MAEVIVNVKGNTTQAQDSVDDLNKSLDKTADAADAASDSLERQEARIKTLGGAINIVGGSVELLAGSLAATGAISEENAEQFTAAAVSALALADGAKRVQEGYVELKEGLKLATQAQKANNLAALANPYVAVAAALVAVTAGLALYADANSEAAKQRKILNNIESKALENSGVQIAQLEILKDRINDTTLSEEARENALKKLQELIPDLKVKDLDRAGAIEDVTEAINGEIAAILKRARVAAAEEQLTELYRERFEIQQQIAEQQEKQRKAAGGGPDMSFGMAPGAIEIDIFSDKIARLNGQLQDSQEEIDFISNLIKDDLSTAVGSIAETVDKGKKESPGLSREKAIELFIKPKLVVPDGKKEPETLAEWFESQIDTPGAELRPIPVPVQFEADLGETTLLERAQVLGGKIGEAMGTPIAEGIGSNLDAVAQLTDSLVEIVDDGSKEGFEAAKKYKIADVVTSSAQAAFSAFAAAQAYGPILGPILGAAQVAAIAVVANRTIQDIRSSTFSGGSISGGIGSEPSLPSTGGGQQVTGVPSIPGAQFGDSGVTTLNAVVLSGEMTSAQAQDAAIRNRRRFGGGG